MGVKGCFCAYASSTKKSCVLFIQRNDQIKEMVKGPLLTPRTNNPNQRVYIEELISLVLTPRANNTINVSVKVNILGSLRVVDTA